MVSFRVIPAFLVAASLLSPAASAASITNRDDRDRKVTIIEGETRKDHVLKPNDGLQGVCETGCLIRLDDSSDDAFELEGSEVTSIEEGLLYDDEQEVPVKPSAESTGQSSPSGSSR